MSLHISARNEVKPSPPHSVDGLALSILLSFASSFAIDSVFKDCLVDDQSEVADLRFFRGVRSLPAIFVLPVQWDDYSECVVDDAHLEVSIHVCRGAERRRGIDLDEPRLELLVYKDVITVHFEAMLVVDDDGLN